MSMLSFILIVLIIVSIYIIVNQIRKQEALEDYIVEVENSNDEYYELFEELKNRMKADLIKMQEIDRLGSFESDDETSFIFLELLDIIEKLDEDLQSEPS